MFEVDEKFNFRYINVDTVPRITVDADRITGDALVHEDNQRISHTEANNKINTVNASVLPTIHQPPGKCDPVFDLPCLCPRRRFADPPDQLPMPATRSNIPALE